eukprot:490297-Prorocentrum_minimum.AAC.3
MTLLRRIGGRGACAQSEARGRGPGLRRGMQEHAGALREHVIALAPNGESGPAWQPISDRGQSV